ncbi:disintegrin and metalloproteinase domain-containing protein 33-like [Rhinophrynus dorsalis]
MYYSQKTQRDFPCDSCPVATPLMYYSQKTQRDFPCDSCPVATPLMYYSQKAQRDFPCGCVRPARGEVLVTAEGRRLILEVERNHLLLSPDYTETHYTEDGQMVTVSPDHTDHCYYHGQVRNHKDSWVTLSTCSGISGLIVLGANDSYYLKPLAAPGSKTHMMYDVKHLNITGGSCGYDGHSGEDLSHINDFLSQPGHHRMKRNVWGAQKYMELFIVADHSMFLKQNRNLGQTKQRILEIANYVDKFYMSMNIKVALIGLEVWTERDHCEVTDDANYSLRSFLQWKQKLKSRKKHDNAQLVTGVTFRGTTIGMAPLEGMCTIENSGGVSMDHSDLAIGAAATMAHEIGHNFGMSHDSLGCCVEATPEQGGCIMASATGKRPMKYFFNECTNPCCNANNCTLKEGAQCAHGDCCQNCKVTKAAGTLCREMSGYCDLPEYCKGDAPYCPPNVYLLDGSPCSYGEAYCFNGMCLTHHQQCVQLWGSGARVAPDICFQDVNKAGDKYGNCGKDGHGQYVKCRYQDAKCGKIQCQSSAQNPKDPNMVSMNTTIRINGRAVLCRGTHSYSMQEEEGDPGLVMTGTKCGDGMVCRDRRCQNASFFELDQCVSQCHGHGVCNSNRHCHCHSGWAPPYCEKSGMGGSVDSGPVQDDIHEGLIIFLVILFLTILLAVAVALFFWSQKPGSHLNKWLRKSKAKCGMDKATHQKTNRGHSNTIFTLRNVSSPAKPRGSQKGSRDILQGKVGAAQNSSQPINIVRPMRPPPSPMTQPSKPLKPSRPPPPAKASPVIAAKEENVHVKLLPPKKPLPSCPVRTPQLNPPRRPLPGNPTQKEPLLVMTPAQNKPPITNSATQLKGPHRPVPGGKVHAVAAAFLQKK